MDWTSTFKLIHAWTSGRVSYFDRDTSFQVPTWVNVQYINSCVACAKLIPEGSVYNSTEIWSLYSNIKIILISWEQ